MNTETWTWTDHIFREHQSKTTCLISFTPKLLPCRANALIEHFMITIGLLWVVPSFFFVRSLDLPSGTLVFPCKKPWTITFLKG